MTRPWCRPAVVVLAVALLLGGCGDDGTSPPGDAGPTTSTIEDVAPADTDGPSGDGVGDRVGEAPGGGPGTENIGVGERVTIRVLDEDGESAARQEG